MKETSIVFNSRDERYKSPYGALRSGMNMTVRILVDRDLCPRRVRLVMLYDRHHYPAYYEMAGAETPIETDNYIEYSVSLPVEDTGLYWYHFQVETPNRLMKIGRADDNRAELQDFPKSWQLTVYRRSYETPEWIFGGVYYHIFVDRFAQGENPRLERALAEERGAAGENGTPDHGIPLTTKIRRDDWGGVPQWQPEDGKIYNRDFFGGNLAGIRKKLPYLQELGVTCLYLSPIFEAYSNHKYDTGDYSRIDPMFGSEEDFRALCRDAMSRGIRVICDGVFSHTGSDSVYFDKYGHFGGGGAWHNVNSRYRDWYYFHENDTYESWWGIDTLPRLNKTNPDYQKFICGRDGIIRRWLRAGASGWRLDVADELDTGFLKALVRAAKSEKQDSIIIGEVWEDASNKISYGERRNYFEGDKLDSVMNYPFRAGIIDFVRNGNAWQMAATVDQIMENYPSDVVNSLMNLLGTHDSVRILTALAGRDLGPDPSREQQANTHLTEEERRRGLRMLKIAVVIQMTLPGVPCIYYGDEAETEGYKDPFNRTCYPWRRENKDLQAWYRKIIAIRKSYPVYKRGRYRTIASIEGLYAFERFDSVDSWYGDAFSDRDHLDSRPSSLITCANCGEREATLFLDSIRVDLLTGERKKEEKITVFPGEVMILAEDEEGV